MYHNKVINVNNVGKGYKLDLKACFGSVFFFQVPTNKNNSEKCQQMSVNVKKHLFVIIKIIAGEYTLPGLTFQILSNIGSSVKIKVEINEAIKKLNFCSKKKI